MKCSKCGSELGQKQESDLGARILAMLGNGGMERSALLRATKVYASHLDSVLGELQAAGRISVTTRRADKSGRPATVYTAAGKLPSLQ